jgi:hypothetical protein
MGIVVDKTAGWERAVGGGTNGRSKEGDGE